MPDKKQPTLEELLAQLDGDIRRVEQKQDDATKHGPSRFVGHGADPEYVKEVAAGQVRGFPPEMRIVEHGTGRVITKSFDSGRSRETPDPRRAKSNGFARSILKIARHETADMRPLWTEKALAESTDSAGGYLLEPEIAQEVMAIIRARVAVTRLPVTTVRPRSKRFDLPGLQAGSSASWLPENGAIPYSAQTFELVADMVPHAVGQLSAVSNRLLADATADNSEAAAAVEQVIRNDVADSMAVGLDSGLINGAGTYGPTTNLLSFAGATPLSGSSIPANGFSLLTPPSGQTTYGLLVNIVNTLREASMPFSSPGWLFNPRTLSSLEQLTDSMGRPLLKESGDLTVNTDGSSGTLLGLPFYTTASVPVNQTQGTSNNASTILFSSDWSEVFLGLWEDIAIDSSGEASYTTDGTTWISAYQSNQTVFRALCWADLAVRRAAAFVRVGGILP